MRARLSGSFTEQSPVCERRNGIQCRLARRRGGRYADVYGKGAGQLAAASAALDVMFLARLSSGTDRKVPYVEVHPERSLIVSSTRHTRLEVHYLRFMMADEPGVLAKITRILGDRGISIASLVQEGADVLPKGVPIVVVTHEAQEGSVRAAILEIDALDIVVEKTVDLRIEDVAR